MRTQSLATSSNVVRFPGPRSRQSADTQQKGLLDTVYTSGFLVVAAEDRETKTMAARLQIFGFLNVAEVLMERQAAWSKGDRQWTQPAEAIPGNAELTRSSEHSQVHPQAEA